MSVAQRKDVILMNLLHAAFSTDSSTKITRIAFNCSRKEVQESCRWPILRDSSSKRRMTAAEFKK